jgi:BNR repeat-containing family member
MSLSRVRFIVLSVGIATVLISGVIASAPAPERASALPLRQRELNPSGGWCWFGDPRAIYYQGAHRRTYVGWVSRACDIQVASYDHDTGQRMVTTIRAKFQIDDHASPSLLVRPDGHLIAFWSGHFGNAMFYRRTVNPEDISSWEPERTVPTNTPGTYGYTYPNPFQLSAEGNRIWLLWRGGNYNPTFSTSSDEVTWEPARTLISVPGQRPYVKVASNGVDTFHLAFTQGHPRNLQTNIYYARYRAGSFYHANGSLIEPASQLPFTPAQADKVYDAAAHGGVKAWIHDVAFDSAGRPVVVFATFPSSSDHRYHYARWNGSRWEDHEFVRAGGTMSGDPSEPDYSGGVTLDHRDPRWVFLAKQVNGKFEIQAYRTTDGGHTWGSRVVTTRSGRGNYRPVRPRGQPGTDMDVVWMRGGYPSFHDYRTAIDVEALSRDALNPAAVALGTGQLQVLASDGTGALISKSSGPTGWSDWTGVGRGPAGHILGAPAVASSAPGRLDLFVVDKANGHLLQRAQVGGVWGAWSDRGAGPGGHPISAPAVASWAQGRLDVVARDTVTLRLLHWWFNGSWHGPESPVASPGGVVVPSVAAWGSNRLDVFAVTDRGTLAHAWWDGRWHGWQSLGAGPGGVAYKTPAAVASWGARRLDVFAATSGGRTLAHRWFSGSTGWLGPETLAAGTGPDRLPLAGMAATSWAPGRLDVFSTDARNHGLLHTWYTAGWYGPEHVDFTNAAPAILADPNPRTTPIPVDPRALNLADD